MVGERPATVVNEASSKDRKRVFACAFATCAVSVTVGSLAGLFFPFSDVVQGVSTIVLGVVQQPRSTFAAETRLQSAWQERRCLHLPVGLTTIFMNSPPQIASGGHVRVVPRRRQSTRQLRHAVPPGNEDCGWASERNYPCISPEYYAAMRATSSIIWSRGHRAVQRLPERLVVQKSVCVRPLRDLRGEFTGFCVGFRWNVAFGVDDRAFLLGLDVVQPVVSKIANMPSYVLAAKVCAIGRRGDFICSIDGPVELRLDNRALQRRVPAERLRRGRTAGVPPPAGLRSDADGLLFGARIAGAVFVPGEGRRMPSTRRLERRKEIVPTPVADAAARGVSAAAHATRTWRRRRRDASGARRPAPVVFDAALPSRATSPPSARRLLKNKSGSIQKPAPPAGRVASFHGHRLPIERHAVSGAHAALRGSVDSFGGCPAPAPFVLLPA